MCSVVFLISLGGNIYTGVSLYHIFDTEKTALAMFETLKEKVSHSAIDQSQNISKYQSLKKENADLMGWIAIAGTTIDFPVMQTPQDANFYLTHDFNKKENAFGTPYLDGECNLESDNNLIIYSHNVRNNQMFGTLKAYTSEGYAKKHRTITLDVLTARESYEVIGVFTAEVSKGDKKVFDYRTGIDCKESAKFAEFMKQYRENAVIILDDMVSVSDKLLMLSTCEYTHENGRLVVVAKRVLRSEYAGK